MLTRVALVLSEGVEVVGVFDLATPLPGAHVRGDFVVAVEDAHESVGGDEGQRLSRESVRDRVVVAVEAEIGRLARAERVDRVAVERVLTIAGIRRNPIVTS
jgi:hypothetical protein